MKGIYKGVKYTLSQMFVSKEPEFEIGAPTDVKHVSHIGWDGSSGSAPTWMNQFNASPAFAETTIGNSGSALAPWSSSQAADASESTRHQQSESPRSKKVKRKKCKSTVSTPKSTNNSVRPSRIGKSKPKYIEDNAMPTDIEVA